MGVDGMLKDDLAKEVEELFHAEWTKRDGEKVPEPEDLKLGNDVIVLDDAVVLYADLADSTELVDQYKPLFAAEVYKAYLHCAARIVRDEGGIITAYDGDRVMGIFIGDSKNTSAARCALKINGAVVDIINPALKQQYPKSPYEVRQAVGVDSGSLHASRTGVRGANDVVWVGRAANYAAKLCSLRDGLYASWITKRVHDRLREDVKVQKSQSMWEARTWTKMNNLDVLCSSWKWAP